MRSAGTTCHARPVLVLGQDRGTRQHGLAQVAPEPSSGVSSANQSANNSSRVPNACPPPDAVGRAQLVHLCSPDTKWQPPRPGRVETGQQRKRPTGITQPSCGILCSEVPAWLIFGRIWIKLANAIAGTCGACVGSRWRFYLLVAGILLPLAFVGRKVRIV